MAAFSFSHYFRLYPKLADRRKKSSHFNWSLSLKEQVIFTYSSQFHSGITDLPWGNKPKVAAGWRWVVNPIHGPKILSCSVAPSSPVPAPKGCSPPKSLQKHSLGDNCRLSHLHQDCNSPKKVWGNFPERCTSEWPVLLMCEGIQCRFVLEEKADDLLQDQRQSHWVSCLPADAVRAKSLSHIQDDNFPCYNCSHRKNFT